MVKIISFAGNTLERFCDWQVEKVMNKAQSLNLIKDERTYRISKYNVEVIFFSLYKTLLMIVIAFLFHIQSYFFVLMFAYIATRTFSHGVHVQNDFLCLSITLLNFFGGIGLSLHIAELYQQLAFSDIQIICIAGGIFISSFILSWIYAPAQTKKRPIKSKERKRKKRLTLAGLTFVFILAVIMILIGRYEYSVVIQWAMVFQTICILPITYKILRQERGINYD